MDQLGIFAPGPGWKEKGKEVEPDTLTQSGPNLNKYPVLSPLQGKTHVQREAFLSRPGSTKKFLLKTGGGLAGGLENGFKFQTGGLTH